MNEGIMKRCCGHCPYSREGTLFLTLERAEEFATHAENPYNDFVCHKTALVDSHSDMVRGEKSLTCMGFASMQHNIHGHLGEGFVPDPDAFYDYWEMVEHHTEKYEEKL